MKICMIFSKIFVKFSRFCKYLHIDLTITGQLKICKLLYSSTEKEKSKFVTSHGDGVQMMNVITEKIDFELVNSN